MCNDYYQKNKPMFKIYQYISYIVISFIPRIYHAPSGALYCCQTLNTCNFNFTERYRFKFGSCSHKLVDTNGSNMICILVKNSLTQLVFFFANFQNLFVSYLLTIVLFCSLFVVGYVILLNHQAN